MRAERQAERGVVGDDLLAEGHRRQLELATYTGAAAPRGLYRTGGMGDLFSCDRRCILLIVLLEEFFISLLVLPLILLLVVLFRILVFVVLDVDL